MPWVILLTDRRKLGAPIRAVAKPYLKRRTTGSMRYAWVFRSEKEARRFMPRDLPRHWLAVISEV